MAETVNSGTNFFVWNFSVGTTDTPIVLNQYISSAVIRCRSSVDIQIRRSGGDTPYFTIPSGSALTLDITTRTFTPFALTSTSGTVTVEILGAQE